MAPTTARADGNPFLTLRRQRADLAALLVVLIWGINFVFLKAALAEFDVLALTFLRYAGMLMLGWGLVLGLGLRRRRQALHAGLTRSEASAPLFPRVSRAELPRLAAAGFLGFTLYMLLSALGLNYTSAFSTALLLAVAPFFMLLLLWLLRVEVVGAVRVVGMVISLAGVLVFILAKQTIDVGTAPAGDLIALGAALAFAAYTVVNKPLAARYPIPVLTTYTLTIGAGPVLLICLPALLSQDWARVTPAGWAAVVWASIVPVYFAWSVWSWATAGVGVARTSVYMYLVPIISGITSWLLLGESFGLQQVLGALLALGGLALARRRAAAQPAVAAHEAYARS